MKDKVYLVVLIILILAIVGQSIYFRYSINQYKNFVEAEITVLKDTLSSYEVKEAKIIKSGLKHTKNASNSKKAINTKLKQDETTIDSSDVTDDDIKRLLSKYHER
jgi:hypothetical protein